MKTKLDNRLLAVASCVEKGAYLADIGTDHAYLPIHLLREGIISGAVACDINAGPIESARMHIAAAGYSDRIDTLLTDGLYGVEPYAPDDILIFGMGGDLIVKILSEAPWIKNERIGLILQPMSRVSTLRQWLCENGFLITGESIGQVASQTMESIYAINDVATMPILRPCITMEKEEIIQIAQKIDTYETSILPYEDCCTVFTPKHPKTKPTIAQLVEAEQKLDRQALIARAMENIEKIKVSYHDEPLL